MLGLATCISSLLVIDSGFSLLQLCWQLQVYLPLLVVNSVWLHFPTNTNTKTIPVINTAYQIDNLLVHLVSLDGLADETITGMTTWR